MLNFTEQEFNNQPEFHKKQLTPLFNDVMKVRVAIYNKFKGTPEYVFYLKQKDFKDAAKVQVTIQAIYCQTVETHAVIGLINYLKEALKQSLLEIDFSVVPNNTTKELELENQHMFVTIPFFDGVLLHFPNFEITDNLMCSVTEYNESNPYGVQFVVKELEQPRGLFEEELFSEILKVNDLLRGLTPQSFNKILSYLGLVFDKELLDETYDEEQMRTYFRKKRGRVVHEMLLFKFKPSITSKEIMEKFKEKFK